MLDKSEKIGGNRDYILKYQLAGGKIQSGLLLYEGEKENFFLLMVQPPKKVKPLQIPPREYIFIVDVSGSMRGYPLEVSKKMVADLINNPRENYFEVAKSLWDWEAGEELGRINVPTLIMVGEKDDRTPPRFSRLIHDKIPNSRLVIVKGAGHCLPLERPGVVNAQIISFLRKADY